MSLKLGLSLLIFFVASITYAQDIQVVTEDWRPYNYEENGVIKGLGTEIVEATLNEAKLPYKVKESTFLEGGFAFYPLEGGA